MTAELETILNEMKDKGIGGAIVRMDGVLVQSTIALSDTGSNLISSITNISDAILKRMEDSQKDIEVNFGGLILVMVPVNQHIFCGLVKDREEKKIVLDYAQKAKSYL